jgi:hypothetical protein
MTRLDVPRRTIALVLIAGCGGSLARGGGTAGAAGSVAIGAGAAGSNGAGSGGGAAAGSAECPRAPATNNDECHPEDTGLWTVGYSVPSVGGECTPGLTCEIPVGLNNTCAQALGLQTFVCCPAVFPNVAVDSLAPLHTGWVPGFTIDACPQPLPGQDPACALPLAAACGADGLACRYQSAFGAGGDVDAGCLQCGGTHEYTIRCCGGVWTPGATCPGDAGMD